MHCRKKPPSVSQTQLKQRTLYYPKIQETQKSAYINLKVHKSYMRILTFPPISNFYTIILYFLPLFVNTCGELRRILYWTYFILHYYIQNICNSLYIVLYRNHLRNYLWISCMITVECTPRIVPCIYLIICRFSSFECRKISASLSLTREVDWRKPRLWGEKIKKKNFVFWM